MKIILILISLLLLGCDTKNENGRELLSSHLQKQKHDGLKRIIKDRYIRILTTRNAFDFYIYQGKNKGIQYEMTKEFLKYLNTKYAKDKSLPKIRFEIIPVDNDQLIPMLLAGKGDIIAAGLSVTQKRIEEVQFTKPYKYVDEVVITRKSIGDTPFSDKTFFVRESSSYWEALLKYNDKVATNDTVNLLPASEDLHTENIIELISLGKFDYTLVDSYIADMALKTYKDLHIHKSRAFGKNIPVAWSVRKNNGLLLKELNIFMDKVKQGSLLGNIFSNKYFSDMNKIASDDFDIKTSKLSKFDDQLKKYSTMYNFDWKLMAALCFQESRFNPNITNKWGAIGLFQIKQSTVNEPYIKIPKITGIKYIENNIHAGIKYFHWIKNRYFDSNPNMTEADRIRMTLAAYNAGPATVLRAMKLAVKMRLNPNIWFRQVELAMLKMKKIEPVNYVSEINKRYISYHLLGIK
jgi:membrane-bound lytic murein transglycosylase MltF